MTSTNALQQFCCSFVSGFALGPVSLQGQLDVQAAIMAARLEETYQMDEWGLVEGGHDIDIADIQVRIAGPTVFLRLLQQNGQQRQEL